LLALEKTILFPELPVEEVFGSVDKIRKIIAVVIRTQIFLIILIFI
jgi:hypothetical protein